MLDALLTSEVTEFDVLEAYFLQALYWSLGAGLLEDGRTRFDNHVKNMAALTSKDDDFASAGRLMRAVRYTSEVGHNVS